MLSSFGSVNNNVFTKYVTNIPTNVQLINNANIPFSSTNRYTVTVAASAPNSYLNGIYTISASSEFNATNGVFCAFQTYSGSTGSINNAIFWLSQTTYTGNGNPTVFSSPTTGLNLAYTVTAPSNTIIGYGSNPYYGVWIQIKFPFSFVCTKFIQKGRGDGNTTTVNYNFMLVGSNDGINFTMISNVAANTSLTYTGNIPSNTGSYSHYRLIINAFTGADNSPSVQYLWLFS